MKKGLCAALMALLVTSAGFASGDTWFLAQQCERIGFELDKVAKARSQDVCSGDVLVASAYIKSASYQLAENKKDKALLSLGYGQNELDDLIKHRAYCQALVGEVKPMLAEVILVKGQLESAMFANTITK